MEASDRQEQGEQPQGRCRRLVADPHLAQPGRGAPQGGGRRAAADDAVLEASGEDTGEAASRPTAQLSGGEIGGAGAYAGRSHGKRQDRYGEDQLQKADPFRADAAGEIDLEAHAGQPEKEVRSRQEHRLVEDLTAFFHSHTPIHIYGGVVRTCGLPSGQEAAPSVSFSHRAV